MIDNQSGIKVNVAGCSEPKQMTPSEMLDKLPRKVDSVINALDELIADVSGDPINQECSGENKSPGPYLSAVIREVPGAVDMRCTAALQRIQQLREMLLIP